MATIKPFKAVRPDTKFADKVAALPYDVMNSDEAREMVKGNPYSFLHVDKAEIDLEKGISLYDNKVYEKAKDNLNKMIQDKVFIQDSSENLYIYKLTMNSRSQYGLVACASVDEYLDGTIKKHELTLAAKEEDRIRHVDTCDANTGPIFLAYRQKTAIDKTIATWVANNKPIYDFVSDDGISHTVWVIDSKTVVNELIHEFKAVENLYIADGHHRNASAVKVALKRRLENPNYDKNAEFNYYLSVIFPSNELEIFDYNRLVKDLNGLTEDQFLQKLEQSFCVEKYTGEGCFKPSQKYTFGLYMNNTWYKLKAKDSIIHSNDVVADLDVSIMQNEILTKILAINDPRTDKRIDFVGGIRGLMELKRRVDSGDAKIAFSMYPTSMDELMSVADQNKIMPPKSTWFEPKLRSGLFIHLLSTNQG